jgi:hypothetical protein
MIGASGEASGKAQRRSIHLGDATKRPTDCPNATQTEPMLVEGSTGSRSISGLVEEAGAIGELRRPA